MAGELYLQGLGGIGQAATNLMSQGDERDMRWQQFMEQRRAQSAQEKYQQQSLAQQAQLAQQGEQGAQQRAALGQWGQQQQQQYDQPYRQAQMGLIGAQTQDIPVSREQAQQSLNMNRMQMMSNTQNQQAKLQQDLLLKQMGIAGSFGLQQMQDQGAMQRTQATQQGAMDRTQYQTPQQQYFSQQFAGGDPSDAALKQANAYIAPPKAQDPLKAAQAARIQELLTIVTTMPGKPEATEAAQELQYALWDYNQPKPATTDAQRESAAAATARGRASGTPAPRPGSSPDWPTTMKAMGEGQQLAAQVAQAMGGVGTATNVLAKLSELGENASPLARYYAGQQLRNWGFGGEETTQGGGTGGFTGSQLP